MRRLACALLPRFAGFRGFEEIRKQTRRTANLHGKHAARRWQAVDALSALRDAEVIEAIIGLLEEQDPELLEHAHRALVLLPCSDHGRSHRRWRAWFDKHGREHRVEWLIEALLDAHEPCRLLASTELERITQERYGFLSAAPKKDRERVYRRYRAWWEREGRSRFA